MNSTLAIAKSEYESEMGEYMGWGRGLNGGDQDWTPDKVIKIQFDMKSGLRRWYFCGHNWSFLRPFATLTLKTGETTVQLPDDFCGVDGGTKLSVTNDDACPIGQFPLVGAGRVVQALAETPSTTGVPRLFAQRPKKTVAPGKIQTSELIVFPEADQDYTIRLPYTIAPDYLIETITPYPLGGVEHHEAILAQCLAVAELRRDNTLGVMNIDAEKMLQRAKDNDRRKNPNNLGQNRDTSDGVDWDRYNGHGWTQGGGVVINGINYD